VSGRVVFQATLTGGGSTTADDTGRLDRPARRAAARRARRRPDARHGGSTAGHVSPALVQIDDLGQVLFQVPLVGGAMLGNSLWVWDPVLGLTPIVLPGDQIEIAPGTFRTIGTFAVGGTPRRHRIDARLRPATAASRCASGSPTAPARSRPCALPVATTTPTAFCFGDG
jgi:hypothetical protein